MGSGALMVSGPVAEFEFTEADFRRVRELIYRHAGITLADGKQRLVYGRLSRRLRALGLHCFSEYLQRVRPGEPEWQPFINALTTNLTAFFREPHHFEVLADFLCGCGLCGHDGQRGRAGRPLRMWSAASSTGEEAYSMAITALTALGESPPVQILASDLDTAVLHTAAAGIYELERIEQLEPALKKRFFRRGRGANAGLAQVAPAVRQLVRFQQVNLLDAQWELGGRFDVVFCRNVMIYFDRPTQRRLLEHLVKQLQPDGLLMVGHAESLHHAADLLQPLGRTVYRPVAAAGRATP